MTNRTMRAAVLHGKEDVRIESVPVPEVGPGEVLLRTGAALTCGTDVKVFRRGYHARMLVPPTLFGHEIAGTVFEVGEGVAFRPGDRVVAANSAPCEACPPCRAGRPNLCDDLLFWNGAYAEFARIPARIVACNMLRLPEALPFASAALVEPLACVVRGVEACAVKAGDSVAVIGAGPIGLLFMALAKRRGAQVIAVGRRREALDRTRTLGAESTVQITDGEDVVARVREASPGGRGPDVVVDAVGLAETARLALESVGKGGRVNLFAGCPAGEKLAVDPARLHYDEIAVLSTFHHTPAAVREALRLIGDEEIGAGSFVGGTAPLDALPEILGRAARGASLKTAIIP
jgi:L-iditol 2-dehydrogenase